MFDPVELIRSVKKELFIASVVLFGVLSFSAVFTYAYFAKDLKTEDLILNRNSRGVKLTDRKDRIFFSFYQAKHRVDVGLSEVSLNARNAIISVEDKNFYKHSGFSIRGIIRSFINDIEQKNLSAGGSTITQQLVKNALLTPRKSFLRKYQELILAQEIERRYSKDEIYAMYLNSVYFGEGAFGIQEAAQRYFGKPAKSLTLAEGSVLAAILPSPSKLSPLNGDKDKLKERQKLVLQKMVEQKYITSEEKNKAEQEVLVFNPSVEEINSKAPHFALMVKKELIDAYGEEKISRSGYVVKTSIDLELQEYAEKVVTEQVKNLAYNRVSNGAAVVIDPKTGEIKALVGSINWFAEGFGKVNIATSFRQPGSSFKPIVYIAAMEKNLITPATILKDMPTTYKIYNEIYSPKNYDGKFRGVVTMRRSLANSLNVPSVEVMAKLGVGAALEMARRLGITTLKDESNYGLSLVLGAGEVSLLEHTNVYATLANEGKKNQITSILEIKDKHGNVIYDYQPNPEQVVAPEYTFLISSILSDNKTRAEVFGNTLTISRPAAVKTGTTENYRDAWTMGYTPSVAVGVWVGNNDGRLMDNTAGSLGAAPIWKALMEKYLEGKPIERFVPSSGIVQTTMCGQVSFAARQATGSAILEYFAAGTEPKEPCTITPTPSSNSPPPVPTNTTPLPTQVPTVILSPRPTSGSPTPKVTRRGYLKLVGPL